MVDTLYNLTNVSEANNLADIIIQTNNLSNGLLAGIIILGLFLILFIVYKHHGTKEAMLISSFITTAVSIPLWLLGLVGMNIMFYPIIILVIAIIIRLFTSE